MPIYLGMAELNGNKAAEGVPAPSNASDDLLKTRVDRTAFSVVSMDQADEDGVYWATRTVEERLEAIEVMRRIAYGDAASGRLQRVFEVVQRPPA